MFLHKNWQREDQGGFWNEPMLVYGATSVARSPVSDSPCLHFEFEVAWEEDILEEAML